LGYGNSEVRVNVELDFTQVDKTITDFDPEKQVVRSEQNILDKSSSSDSLSYPHVSMDKDLSNQIANYEISKSVERIIQGVGNIKRLSIAALINGTQKVGDKEGKKVMEYVPRADEEMKKLEDIVKNAVGFDITRNDQVTVVNVPFETHFEQPNLEELNKPLWYEDPENIKLIALILLMIGVIILIYKILQSKLIKDRFRIALMLPAKIQVDEEEEEQEAEEEELEEIEFDDDDLLLLPAELPEQLLLEGERLDSDMEALEEAEEDSEFDLAGSASASLDGAGVMTEEALMKIELKNKVENYIDEQTQEAVKLVRILLAQDLDYIKM